MFLIKLEAITYLQFLRSSIYLLYLSNSIVSCRSLKLQFVVGIVYLVPSLRILVFVSLKILVNTESHRSFFFSVVNNTKPPSGPDTHKAAHPHGCSVYIFPMRESTGKLFDRLTLWLTFFLWPTFASGELQGTSRTRTYHFFRISYSTFILREVTLMRFSCTPLLGRSPM